jgi:acylphosphatase
MNERDGSVRVVVEGVRSVVEGYVEELRRGPRLARVTRVDVGWTPARGEFTGFGIRYSGRDA